MEPVYHRMHVWEVHVESEGVQFPEVEYSRRDERILCPFPSRVVTGACSLLESNHVGYP